MAAIDSSKTFHIIYGWAEGRWHAKRLVRALQSNGFSETSKDKAAIIIAHSAGSFFVPQASDNQICVIIGFPHWPHKSLLWSSVQKVWRDMIFSRPGYWILKTGWNLFYLARYPLLTWHEWQALNQTHPFSVIPKTAIMIRNQDDAFCPPNLASFVPNQVIMLPGQHDDLWLNTNPYVEIVEAAYAKLLV